MQEHSVEDEQTVGFTSLLPWIFIKKQVHIQVAFCLPNGQPFTLCQPFGWPVTYAFCQYTAA